MHRCGSWEAKPLWGFDGSRWGAMAAIGRCIGDDIVPLRDGDDVRPDSGMTWRPRMDVLAPVERSIPQC